MADKLVLVDGSSYLYRAFHAMPNLTNSQGEPTGAVYGVVNMLRRLLKEQPSEYFAVVFDASGPTFRDQMYPEYKANRPPMPGELRAQIQPLHDVISALGLPLICVKGVEADDVIGTLTVAASEIGIETLIASGDKDLAQLVGDKVLLMDSMKGITYNTAGVVNKFGVPPERMVDFLTLVGDSVDNIPGVPKVGPKTASKWLNEFGSLDELVQHADDISGKVGENLRAALDQLPMSRALATIKLDVQLDVHPDGLQLQPADKSRLRTLYAGLEFKTWLSELGGLSGGDDKAKSPSVDYQVIFDQKALNRWIKRLQSAKLISVDTETTSLDPMQARIVGLSFTDRPCEAAYLPLGHDYAGAPDQ
ncbi:MAG: 5'-3' exonuclease H3TH domain-containing protein, partial [Pseudomonadota bacterium]|nr:5'-3' exonuclease H3TH domain-containing protein [Pseudomonadota bacterium]